MRVAMGSTEIATRSCTGHNRLAGSGRQIATGCMRVATAWSADRDDRSCRNQIATERSVATALVNAAYWAVAFTGYAFPFIFPFQDRRLWQQAAQLIQGNHRIISMDNNSVGHFWFDVWMGDAPLKAYILEDTWRDMPNKVVRWLTPPPRRLKLNVDGAFNMMLDESGGGGILRDHKGNMCCAFAKPYHGLKSSLAAEALALRDELSICCSKGVYEVLVETDSLNLMHIVTRVKAEIIHVPREANKVADCLAGFALSCAHLTTWDSWAHLPTIVKDPYRLDKCQKKSGNYLAIAKAVAICICDVILFPTQDHLLSAGNLSIISCAWEGMPISQAVLGYLYAGLFSTTTGGPFFGSVIALECWMGMHICYKATDGTSVK
ncbi:hypothetical protein Taro_022613 [Colocasia esculenta]|uniref:RNase H type-1 domain-containing protein n=1 Tax=Colocasia esculenta TaxID=4460 RepID=A0A843UUX6_COLES|nr:hypothetical protein [Colocasia esculenta]